MSIRAHIKLLLRKMGYNIIKVNHTGAYVGNRIKLLKHYGINLVLDVGANIGQYSMYLRKHGYKGKIISFEPLSLAFKQLEKQSKNDILWNAVNIALGNKNINSKMNVSINSKSSSILKILPKHIEVLPDSAYISTEEISIRTLDSVFNNYYNREKVYLKIDAQGFEKNVLDGAIKSIENITGIQIVMSIVPLYKDELLFDEMIKYLSELGFMLMSIEPGFTDQRTGQLLQFDGIFFRK